MQVAARRATSFPTARIPSRSGGLPVEVTLIAQLGHGAGDRLYHQAVERQRRHGRFSDGLDEPAALLAAADVGRGETTALHSFAVGPKGHPFHRHAGHRIFTAVSGSGGVQLRFSGIADAALGASPASFVDSLHFVNVPPDCLFTVRFGGGTWHQFMPLRDDGAHPALFALSCHTNEMGGITDQGLLEQVRAGAATVQTLTELLPPGADDCLRDHARLREVPVLSLSLREVPGGLLDAVCSVVRRAAGRLRSVGAACGGRVSGFVARGGRGVIALGGPPPDSLLALHLGERFEHEDTFELVLHGYRSSGNLATTLLADVLEGFLCNRPGGVSWLMKVRNLVVKPLRLRTSPLGCPASSLLATEGHNLYAGRFPVLDQRVDPRGLRAEVLLGADDRHLRFRSCVGVRFVGDDAHVTLGTRVQCRNRFGRVYMAVIDRVHRAYISPAMLFMAVEHAQRRVQQVEPSTVLAF